MSKKFEKSLKKLLIKLAIKFFSRKKLDKIPLENISKILIVRQDNRIGNLIMLTPFIKKIKELFPKSTLDIVVGGKFNDVLENNPNISNIYVYDQEQFIKNPVDWLKFIQKLKKIGYDLVIDASHPHSFSFSDALIANLVKPKYVIGFDRDEAQHFYNISIKPDLSIHTSQAILALLEPLGYKNDSFIYPEVFLKSENENFAYNFYEKHNLLHKNVVIIFPGAKEGKKWGIDNFILLHNTILKLNKNIDIIWILGPDEKPLENQLKHLQNIHIVSDAKILDIAAIIKRSKAFISGDTGPMHLSVAVDTPTLQIFLQTTENRFGYNGKNHTIIKNQNPNDVIYLISSKIKKLIDV